MAMYFEELSLYVKQHVQLETEIAKMAERDEDCRILMSHPGINAFTSAAIKSRVGDDAKRFPTKKHFCSYAGVVPGADNSGEYLSDHAHVKHGDHRPEVRSNLRGQRSRKDREEILPETRE